ncbi:MAG: cob(I)yrinic acid a,c-diamide adenosyltransferase [Chitinivibrionales bacterium]|nr:cob(I)yrinic acid a,c-diamide adenosyltransferase [Chitinivibrionales bacterium]
MGPGYVHIYTGNGKGKTTAAFGLALRAAGAGLRVFIGQFVKGMHYSEIDAVEKLLPTVTLRQYGQGCFVTRTPSEGDREAARQGLADAAERLRSGEYSLVILDEACVAVDLGLIETDALLDIVRQRPRGTELVLTGRNAPSELVDIADLVTEMREVKHYYTRGVQARVGIEK